MSIRILSDAEEEIDSARHYFNRQAFALGDRFLDELQQVLEAIEDHPGNYPKLETFHASEPYRRALLKVFRYAVIFEIEAEEIVVLAVAHTSRLPTYWLKRRSP